MRFGIRQTGFSETNRALKGMGLMATDELSKKSLKEAAKITLADMKPRTPVNPKKFWTPKSRIGDRTYERGGVLIQDARVMLSKYRRNRTSITAVVGYSQKKGKVGWRARYIEDGAYNHWAKRFIPAKPWIEPSGRRTIGLVESTYMASFERRLKKMGL